MAPALHHDPALVVAQAVDVRDDRTAVDLEPVPLRADLADGEGVGAPGVAELDRAADDVAGARPATSGGGEERGGEPGTGAEVGAH